MAITNGVNDIIQLFREGQLRESAGSEYVLIKKLQMGGTGSMKMIHIEGIDFVNKFSSTSKSHHYLSFELKPSVLLGRTYGNAVKSFIIKKEAIVKVNFETYNLKLLTKTGFVIRSEAFVEIVLKNQFIKLYIPRTAYKSVKKFFSKDWLEQRTTFLVSESEPEINPTALVAEIIVKLLGQ